MNLKGLRAAAAAVAAAAVAAAAVAPGVAAGFIVGAGIAQPRKQQRP